MIPESQWRWFGYPMHFICADRCLWHLATQVGEYVVSSVGHMRPYIIDTGIGWKDAEPIGCNDAIYEVFVFRVTGRHDCGCPTIEGIELEGYRFGQKAWDEHEVAEGKHRELCLRYAEMQDVAQ